MAPTHQQLTGSIGCCDEEVDHHPVKHVQAVLHCPVGWTDRQPGHSLQHPGPLDPLPLLLNPQQSGLVPEMPLLPGDGVEDGGDNEEAGQAKAIDPG